jgi:hypothetical protein
VQPEHRAKWKNLVTRIISAYERDINRSNEIKKTGKRTRSETTTTIATENQSTNKKKQKMSNDNQQRASAIGRKKKKETKPKTNAPLQVAYHICSHPAQFPALFRHLSSATPIKRR